LHRNLERNRNFEAEFFPSPRHLWNIPMHWAPQLGKASDLNRLTCGPSHKASETGDVQGLVGTHVVDLTGPFVEQDGPEPPSQVLAIEPGADGGTIPLHTYGASRQSVREEAGCGLVSPLQGLARAKEGEATRDPYGHAALPASKATEVLRKTLAKRLGRIRS
jgi:hypothetical protein